MALVQTSKPRVRVRAGSATMAPAILRPSMAASDTYEAGGLGRRSVGWTTSSPGPNAALLPHLDTLRARSRDAVRKNGLVKEGVEILIRDSVGVGLKPQINDVDLQALWENWVAQADAAGMTDFYGIQSIVVRSFLTAGDVFVRFRYRYIGDTDKNGVEINPPFQIQILESEQVPTSKTRSAGIGINAIVAGVEFDAVGRRVAYHMYREHPGDGISVSNFETVRVPAEDVLHVFEVNRPGQVRGEPRLVCALVKARDLDQYDDAEMVRKKGAAMYGGFLRAPSLPEGVAVFGEGTSPDGTTSADEEVNIQPLEPGTFPILPPGYDVTFSEPADVGGNYGAFNKEQKRYIASAIGVLYPDLSQDFDGLNDRSYRAMVLPYRRKIEVLQDNTIIACLCRPTWIRFVNLAIAAGAWTMPAGTTLSQWHNVRWMPHVHKYMNPSQEIAAVIAAIRAGLMSRKQAASELGWNIDDIDREIAADNERADRMGLAFDSDGRKPAGQAAFAPDSEEDQK